MKKIIALLLCVITLFLLCACGVTQEDANLLADKLIGDEYVFRSDDDYTRLKSSSLFADALSKKLGDMSVAFVNCCTLMSKLESLDYENKRVSAAFDARVSAEAQMLAEADSDFDDFCALLKALNEQELELAAIRDAFQKRVELEQAEVFADVNDKLIPYLKTVAGGSDNEYGILPCEYYYSSSYNVVLPYEAMKKAIEEQCIPVVHKDGKGGYYDDKKDEYKDESYYYSPLTHDKTFSWSAGYQRVTIKYRFEGDFMAKDEKYIFPATSQSDEANTLTGTVYYKGEAILYDADTASHDSATSLMAHIHGGDVYELGGTDIFIVYPKFIQMVSGNCFKCISNK